MLRSKGKVKINISQFGTSSSQEFQSIQDLGKEIKFQMSLMKSKYEYDLRKNGITTRRLESYLLDSLWRNLLNYMKSEERNLVVRSFQPHILPVVQTPPAFQAPPLIPNPPRQMDTRFAPLALPVVFHDIPHYYAQNIPFYDGDGNFTTRQHVDKFDDYVDLELVDEDDIKMRLYVLSLSGEAKKWFRNLPSRSIATFEAFQTSFLE